LSSRSIVLGRPRFFLRMDPSFLPIFDKKVPFRVHTTLNFDFHCTRLSLFLGLYSNMRIPIDLIPSSVQYSLEGFFFLIKGNPLSARPCPSIGAGFSSQSGTIKELQVKKEWNIFPLRLPPLSPRLHSQDPSFFPFSPLCPFTMCSWRSKVSLPLPRCLLFLPPKSSPFLSHFSFHFLFYSP